MLDPLTIYEYLTTSRQRVLDAVRPLTPEQYQQQFPIGLGSLARTLTHIVGSEWYYVQRMLEHEVPPYEQWPIRDENPLPFPTLETEWQKQAAQTRAAILQPRDWHRPQEYQVTDDAGQKLIVTATPAGQFTQLFQHEVHHRAQALNMLRHLGITVGDVDFNWLMFQRRKA